MFLCDACGAPAWTGLRKSRTHAYIAGFVVLFMTPTTVAAQTTAARATAAALARAGDAVVTIVAYREGTTEVTTGIGVRLADGRVVTALRNLRGASRADVFGASGDSLATVSTLDLADVRLDLAILPPMSAAGNRIALSRRSATPAQKVSVLGARKGAVRAITERTVTHVEPDADGRSLLRIGAPITGGMAGSAVVNARGELVAIAVGTIPGRDENDFAVDVSTLRDLVARPAVRLGLPARDGTIAAARAPADPKAVTGGVPARATDAAVKARTTVFPERYGAPISADTARQYAVELFGCARLESRLKVYCYLRITNLGQGATFGVKGADLADSTRRKVGTAANLIVGETSQRIAGWRSKAEIPLRELESVRVALEFAPPERDGAAVRLLLDVAGERTLWLGPFVLQRAP